MPTHSKVSEKEWLPCDAEAVKHRFDNLDGVYLTPNYYAIFIQSEWGVVQGLFVLATEY